MPVSVKPTSMSVISAASSASSSTSAQEPFRSQNYLEAVEMYERTLREKGPNVDLYLGLADSLASAGKIREAMDGYSQAYRTGSVSSDRLKGFVNTFVEYVKSGDRSTTSCGGGGSGSGSIPGPVQIDVSTCCFCWGFLTEPVTLPCGHTFCRKCVTAIDTVPACQRCNLKVKNTTSASNPFQPKVNVVIGHVLEKWWPDESQAVLFRNEGNQLFQKRQIEEAVMKYQRAWELAPKDHLAISNQSHALLQLGRSEEALRCADQATHVRPNWSKAYYRKAMALQSLGRYEDALIAYVQCLALDPDAASVKNELTKLLHKVMSSTISRRLSNELRSSPYPLPRLHGTHSAQDVCESSDSDPDSSDLIKASRFCGKMKRERIRYSSCNLPVPDKSRSDEKSSLLENPQLRRLVDRCLIETDKVKKSAVSVDEWRTFDPNVVDKADFECTLCFRLFWQPVTTPCGHMFCRMCLDRCLDHNPVCPLCKTSLDEYLAERRQAVTEFIKVLMEKHLANDYTERQRVHEEEMTELARAGTDEQHEVSIFVCTTAYPTVPCPLHVFEPRYRLLIRQCMESGTRQFGMCTRVDDAEGGFSEYGTMLEIREVQYFPDGRAVVDCVGNRRFKVLHKGERDGYNTGSVQFLHDDAIEETALAELRVLHDAVRAEAVAWLGNLRESVRQQILSHFGSMPDIEENWPSLSDGPSWCWWAVAVLPLDKQAQLHILAMTSLKKRLESIQWVIRYIQQTGIT